MKILVRFNLTQSRLKELLHYNADTGVFTWLVASRSRKVGQVAGSDNKGYRLIKIKGKSYRAHRLAWLYVHGKLPDNDIDHINGVRDDNRIANMRDVTNSVNGQNRKLANKGSVTGLLGVSKSRKGFKSQIRLEGKQVYLGTYLTPEQAYAVSLAARRHMHAGCTI